MTEWDSNRTSEFLVVQSYMMVVTLSLMFQSKTIKIFKVVIQSL